ncbi:MAG: Flp pilus assembly complex ATPase component TadA, partial [Planctomycetota bacterium]|nr:Flp pilus assembly complex ATPase component TadA [Planctomycetota bacterium]
MFGRKPTTSEAATAVATEETDDLQSLWQPDAAAARKSVEQLLLDRGQISADQVLQAKDVQSKTPGKSVVQILLTMNAATEEQILSAVAETLGIPFEKPEKADIDAEAFALLAPEYIRKVLVVPLRFENDRKSVVVGMTDPNNVFLIDEVRRKTKKDIKVVVTTAADINRIVEQVTQNASDVKVDELMKDMAEDEVQLVKDVKEDDVTDLEKMGQESPVIRFVNYLIFDAIKQGASDIHIEPKEKALKVRYRIDGILFESMNPPHSMHAAVTSRLKIMANLDISERRLPQDGRIRAVVQ